MAVRAEKAIGAAGIHRRDRDAPRSGTAAISRRRRPVCCAAAFSEKGPVGFFDLNLKARSVVYSPAWKRMLGYEDSEIPNTYEAWLGLLHPEDSAAAPDKAGASSGRGAPFAVDFRMKHSSGTGVDPVRRTPTGEHLGRA